MQCFREIIDNLFFNANMVQVFSQTYQIYLFETFPICIADCSFIKIYTSLKYNKSEYLNKVIPRNFTDIVNFFKVTTLIF